MANVTAFSRFSKVRRLSAQDIGWQVGDIAYHTDAPFVMRIAAHGEPDGQVTVIPQAL